MKTNEQTLTDDEISDLMIIHSEPDTGAGMLVNCRPFARAIESAVLARLPAAIEAGTTLPFEQALAELVDKIVPGLDTGNVLNDAKEASGALDKRAASEAAPTIRNPLIVVSDAGPIAPDDKAIFEAWVSASDVDGIAYDGPSFERGYRAGEIAERDRASEAWGDADKAAGLGELNDDLTEILGRPNFTCIRIAELFRISGQTIPRKAEAEQAAVIYFLLRAYLRHGNNWSTHADAELKSMIDAARAQRAAAQGDGNA